MKSKFISSLALHSNGSMPGVIDSDLGFSREVGKMVSV